MDTVYTIFEYQHPAWQAVLLAVLPILSVIVAWQPLRKIYRHRQLQQLIRRLGKDQIKQSRISNGEDEVYVEHLVLQPDGLVLLMLRPYRGNIFAAEKIEMWTQVLGHHSYKFPNPLYELERDTQLLRAMLGGVQVRGMVLFGKGSQFPKGKPERVYDFGMLREEAKKSGNMPVPDKLLSAWAGLRNQATPSRHLQQSIFYQKGDKRRLLMGAILILVALANAAWQLGWYKHVW